MITTLSFDLDDTLWDPRPALVAADKAQWLVLSERYPQLAHQFTREHIGGCRKQVITDSPAIVGDVTALRINVMEQLLVSLGISASEASESASVAFGAFMKRRNDVVVYTDTHPMLGELSTSYKIVAITNGNADVFKTDIGRYFDLAIRADEVGVAKPDRRIFDLTWTRIGCTPDQVVHIGDSLENDVQGALNANVLPIWFNPDKDQNKMGVREITQLADLPAMIHSISGQG